jgi:hypothetical protein
MVMVLVIVAVCVAILVPVTSPHPYAGRAAACLSNMKQLGLAAIMYSGDWDDRYPSADWAKVCAPYVRNIGVYTCPAIKDRTPEQFGHSYHRQVVGVKLDKIKDPVAFVMLFDSVDLNWGAVGGLEMLPAKGRVSGRSSVTFLDGHTRRLTRDQLFSITHDPAVAPAPSP